jgi:hypothetical protein
MRKKKGILNKMDIKLNLNNVINIYTLIMNFLKDENTELTAVFKFQLLGIVKGFESAVQNFETIRNEKIREYGEENDNGDFTINPENKENFEKFQKEISSVLDTEITMSVTKLKAEDVFKVITDPKALVILYPIIEA